MIIDKDKFKEYINTKYEDQYHVNEIESIKINKMRYFKDQVDVTSRYNDVVERYGSVEVLMVKVEWLGWKVVSQKSTSHRPEFAGTFAYSNRTNRFNLEVYQEWLIDTRDKKLESIGI